MPEDLLRQILEELRGQDTPAWLEALKSTAPLVVGLFAGAVGYFAVWRNGITQRETVKVMSETQLKAVEDTAAAQ